MEREYKGKVYLEISKEDIVPLVALRCDIFVYLSLNNKMLKIRARSQDIDFEAFKNYFQSKNHLFYILHPGKNSDSYDFSRSESAPINPKIPLEFWPLPSKETPQIEKTEEQHLSEIAAADSAENSKSNFLSSPEEEALRKVEASDEEELAENRISASEKDELVENRIASPEEEDPNEQRFTRSDEETQSSTLVNNSSDDLEEKRFSNTNEDEQRIVLSGDGNDKLEERRFTGGAKADSQEESSAISANSAEADPTRRIKRKSDDSEEETFSIQASNDSAEEEDTTLLTSESEEKSEEAMRFSVDSSGEQTKRLRKSEVTQEAGLSFSSDEENPLEERRIRPSKEVEEALLAFEKEAEEEDQTITQWKSAGAEVPTESIFKSVAESEENLVTISADDKQFIEQLKIVNEENNEEMKADWLGKLDDDTLRSHDADKEVAASARVSLAIGDQLTKYRSELESLSRQSPRTPQEQKDMKDAKKKLRESIKNLEATSVLLEIFDSEEFDDNDLPAELAGKSKNELATHLEDSLAGLSNSDLLREDDHQLMKKKIWKLKSQEYEALARPILEMRDTLSQYLHNLTDEKKSLSEPEFADLDAELKKRVKRAITSEKIDKTLTQLRGNLLSLLRISPKSPEDKKTNEEKAYRLQDGIREMESLSTSNELAQEISPKKLKLIYREEDLLSFRLHFENQKECYSSSIKKLEKLAESMIAARIESAKIAEKLGNAIFGTNNDSFPDTDLEKESQTLLPALASAKNALRSLMNTKAADAEAESAKITMEMQRANALMAIESLIVEKEHEFKGILEERKSAPRDSEARVTLEADALRVQKEIRELRSNRDDLLYGEDVNEEILTKYCAANSRKLAFDTKKPIADEAKRLLDSIDQINLDATIVKNQAEGAIVESIKDALNSDSAAIRKSALEVKELERLGRKLSRKMKEFLQNGKELGPDAIWELNKEIAKEVRSAMANTNVVTQIGNLSRELMALEAKEPKTEEEKNELKRLIAEKMKELSELRKINEAMDNGEAVGEEILSKFSQEVEEKYFIPPDKPVAESITRIAADIATLKEELIKIKFEALEGVPAHYFSNQIDGIDTTGQLVLDQDAKSVQAGIYAAHLFRFFGYQNSPYENELMTACYILNCPEKKVLNYFPEIVQAIFQCARTETSSDEMIIRDLAQAARMAQFYAASPKVVTGSYTIDPDLFAESCESVYEKAIPNFDYELVERAKQQSILGLEKKDRDEILEEMARVTEQINKWKQKLSASR